MKTEDMAKKACDETGGHYTSWLTEFLRVAFSLRDAEAVPSWWHYEINGNWDGFSREKPYDDAYDEGTIVALYEHAPAPSDLVEENERLKAELAEAQSQIDAIPDMLQTVRTQAWADFRQQLRQQEPVEYDVMCESCGGTGFDSVDSNYGCAVCNSTGFVQRKLFTAPATDYKPIAERLLGALEANLQLTKRGCSIYWADSEEAIAAAKAAGLGEE